MTDKPTMTDKPIRLVTLGATRRIGDESQERIIYRQYLVRAWQLKCQQLHKFHHYQKCHR